MNSPRISPSKPVILDPISRHLESYRGVSAAVPGPGTVASRSPYPNLGLLVLVENGGRGNYNSLGTKLTKRYSNGLTALVSYTWSKSIDTTSGIRTSDSDSLFSQDGRCMLCDRGLSAFDNRHRLVVSGLVRCAVREGAEDGDSRIALLDASRRRMAGGRHHHLALRIPHQSQRRRESRQHQHQRGSSGRHRAERQPRIRRPRTAGSIPPRSFCSRSTSSEMPHAIRSPGPPGSCSIPTCRRTSDCSRKVMNCNSAGSPTICSIIRFGASRTRI